MYSYYLRGKYEARMSDDWRIRIVKCLQEEVSFGGGKSTKSLDIRVSPSWMRISQGEWSDCKTSAVGGSETPGQGLGNRIIATGRRRRSN